MIYNKRIKKHLCNLQIRLKVDKQIFLPTFTWLSSGFVQADIFDNPEKINCSWEGFLEYFMPVVFDCRSY